jgi:hypothetical protein
MAKSFEVLAMLIPNGGYVQYGTEYEGIQFLECEPISKEQYEAGFNLVDSAKAQAEAEAVAAKLAAEAKLEALGLTNADLRALGL